MCNPVRLVCVAILLGLVAGAVSAPSVDSREPRLVPLAALKQDFEVIFGDPEKPGEPFVMRIRELRGTIIPPHTHPVDEHITVLQGTIYLGTGDGSDRSRLKPMAAGSYAFLPKGTVIFGETTAPAIVQVHGVGPFHLLWKHPVKTFSSPDATQVFKFRAGERVKTKYGDGKIEKGWASGPIIQYEAHCA